MVMCANEFETKEKQKLTKIKKKLTATYSYFEKGCRKKCTQQSLKVLWVVLSSLLFKEVWKKLNDTRGGSMFASAKRKQQK